MNFRHWIAGLAAVTVAGLATSGFAQGVTSDRLLAAGSEAEAGNWLMVHKTYDANRYSSLNQINAGNVAGLHLAFAVPLGGLEPAGFGIGSMEATPLVDNGFMYVTDPWGTPYKIDVSSGKRARSSGSATRASTRTPAAASCSPAAGLRFTKTRSSRT